MLLNEIRSFSLGAFGTNCYYIRNTDTNESIIIDPGSDAASVLAEFLQVDKVKAILLTHAHCDHIFGLQQIRTLTKAPVFIHEAEAEWLSNPDYNGSARWPQLGIVSLDKPAEHYMKDGETLSLLGLNIIVLHTPGHSPGSVSFIMEEHCFSGDALFDGSIGRTDLFGGDYHLLIASIKQKLLTLDESMHVHPGHGPSTTIGTEKKSNPFLAE